MLALLERLIVAAIVAAAFLYAVWALVPAGTRRQNYFVIGERLGAGYPWVQIAGGTLLFSE